MTRLTPSIKNLLSLRKPNAPPVPSLSRLNRVFKETFRDAQAKKAETGWLVAAVSFLYDLHPLTGIKKFNSRHALY